MNLNITNDEFILIESLLIITMREHNKMKDNDYYITREQKEMLGIAKGLLEKLEESK